MFSKLKKFLIGKTLSSDEAASEKFNVFWGLPILSSDAISSVAYASEEILWILVPVIGLLAYKNMFYISLVIILLLLILIFSYSQTIDNYPNGGGSYIVASDNLGRIPGLIAGSSLSIDYILTVAVSTCAGTAAITSAFPALLEHKVLISLIFILILTIGNLRGIKESSRMFGLPTYLFMLMSLIMIATGIFKVYVLGYTPSALGNIPQAVEDASIFLLLRAFASGCTALTGVEAVSNGIPNFKEPSQKNAKKVLYLLGLVVFLIFGGTSFLASIYHTVPSLDVTVTSQIASQVFGANSIMFFILQAATAIILIMASNTSFSGFPLLLSLISKDGYVPRQFGKLGERLSYSNGIGLLAIASGILVIVFRGETHLLIPLYAIGVFTSFTLSQAGMFMKWVRSKAPGWRHKAFINGLGTLMTFATMVIIGVTKFLLGAWIVFILIPAFILLMLKVKSHYNEIARQLSLTTDALPGKVEVRHVIVPVDTLNKASLKAIYYAKCLSDDVIAFHICIDSAATERLKQKWQSLDLQIPLVIKPSPYRDVVNLLTSYIESEEHASKPGDLITVVMPQFIVHNWWHNILHNQTALLIKRRLMKHRNIAVVTVPYVLNH